MADITVHRPEQALECGLLQLVILFGRLYPAVAASQEIGDAGDDAHAGRIAPATQRKALHGEVARA